MDDIAREVLRDAADQPARPAPSAPSPASFLAAAAALNAIDDALRDRPARAAPNTPEPRPPARSRRWPPCCCCAQVREQLAGWETGLIETARDAGASWADLAHPLGVASRQAAERRYLRVRPGPAGHHRRATRDRPPATAAPPTAPSTAWARDNAADLRRLAGQITALTDLPAGRRASPPPSSTRPSPTTTRPPSSPP